MTDGERLAEIVEAAVARGDAPGVLGLVEDGLLGLDEPVDRLLPELADRRVLRRLGMQGASSRRGPG